MRRPGVMAMMLAVMAVTAGCGSSSGLRYKPEAPGVGARVAADYMVLADRVRVEIDTRGTRLEDAQILRADGTGVRPQTVEYPVYNYNPSGVTFGIGMGRSSYGGGGTAVGTGVGFGTTMPVGDAVADGNTVLYFALDQIGPAPWRLQAQLAGLGVAVFNLGTDPSAPPK
jgi:hypothetical protein